MAYTILASGLLTSVHTGNHLCRDYAIVLEVESSIFSYRTITRIGKCCKPYATLGIERQLDPSLSEVSGFSRKHLGGVMVHILLLYWED